LGNSGLRRNKNLLFASNPNMTTLGGAPLLDQHYNMRTPGVMALGMVVVGAFSVGGGRIVDSMYKKLDGVSVWQIQVKTLGFGFWMEPVMATSWTFVKASLR
jgi:hypothetical protein